MCRRILLATALTLLACADRAEAGRFFCHHCGCHQNCKKVCHLKTEKKKETKVEYVCESEDFCIPGPSKKHAVKIECKPDGHHRTIVWQPTCARVHTRKKLVKKEVTKEVPDHKWVVEEYCCVCGHWVKIERDKDKGKEKDKEKGKKDKAGGSEKSSKAGGPSEREKSTAAQSDRPPDPSEDGDLPSGGANKDEGGPKVERIPLPPAQRNDRQTRRRLPADAYRAYYLDADPEAATFDVPAAAEIELNEPETKPRRLFFGCFGRHTSRGRE